MRLLMLREERVLPRRASFGHTWISNSRIRIFRRLQRHEAKAIGYVKAASILETKAVVVDDNDVRARIAPGEPAQTPILYRLVDNTET